MFAAEIIYILQIKPKWNSKATYNRKAFFLNKSTKERKSYSELHTTQTLLERKLTDLETQNTLWDEQTNAQ